jgi:hypothetical protein
VVPGMAEKEGPNTAQGGRRIPVIHLVFFPGSCPSDGTPRPWVSRQVPSGRSLIGWKPELLLRPLAGINDHLPRPHSTKPQLFAVNRAQFLFNTALLQVTLIYPFVT